MASITLKNVSKSFEGDVRVVSNVTLEVMDGELLVLVGPSGCGKTTLLRLIAGLETPTSGQILMGGKDVTGVSPYERNIGFVFQNCALYPHLSVAGNLAFPLKRNGTAKGKIKERVQKTAAMLSIEHLLHRKPALLSGGERQRVAIGRAMIKEPAVFLMDEPLSNLDRELRLSLREEIKKLHGSLGTTTIYVTHDEVEAAFLADRVVGM